MKKTRLLLTLWLMLLTALMPPMAFACASVCAVGCEQMMASPTDETIQAMPPCHHEGMAVAQADKSNTSDTDKTSPCLANIICHLTVGINTAVLAHQTYTPHAVVVTHIPAFIPQVALSPPDKPPRF